MSVRKTLFKRGSFEIWTFLSERRGYGVERTPVYARWLRTRHDFLARQHKWSIRIGRRVIMLGFLLGGKSV